MKLVVVALTFVMTLFTVRAPEEVFKRPTTVVDSGKMAEQEQAKLAAERAEKLAARRAQIAAAKALKGIAEPGVYFPDGGTKDTVGKIVVVTPPSVVDVAGKQGSGADYSAEQIKAIVDAGKQLPFFDAPLEQQHPPSTLETVEAQLSRNKMAQEKIRELQSQSFNPKSQQQLKENLSRLQKQQEVLINSQEFLAYCKSTSSPVTFTGPELEKIFTVLDLPSLSQDSLEGMSIGDLWVFEESYKTTGVLQRAKEQLGKFEPSLLKEQQNILKEYFKDREQKVAAELLKRDLLKEQQPDPQEEVGFRVTRDPLSKTSIEETEAAIKGMVKELKNLLNNPETNKLEIEQEISSLKTMIGRVHPDLDLVSPARSKKVISAELVMSDAQESYKQLIKESEDALAFITKTELIDSFAKGTLQPGDFNQYVRTVVMKDSNLPDLDELKKFEAIKQNDLTPEQKQFVKTMIKQTETFTNLKEQATQAIDGSDVIRMQELQDELRDFYEDLMRSSWKNKNENLNNLDGVFIDNVRASINDLLQQFKSKVSSFEGVVKNKKGYVARVKYQFKRLFARVKRLPELKYRSENSVNKADFGLDLVDFQKAATDDYVATVKSGIKSYGDTLNQATNLLIQASDNINEAIKTNAIAQLPNAIANLKTQIESLEVIQQQRQQLKNMVSSDQAKAILKQLPDDVDAYIPKKELSAGLPSRIEPVPRYEEARVVNLDTPPSFFERISDLVGIKKSKPGSKTLENFVVEGKRILKQLSERLKEGPAA